MNFKVNYPFKCSLATLYTHAVIQQTRGRLACTAIFCDSDVLCVSDSSSTTVNLWLVWLLHFSCHPSSLLSFKMSPVSNPWPFVLCQDNGSGSDSWMLHRMSASWDDEWECFHWPVFGCRVHPQLWLLATDRLQIMLQCFTRNTKQWEREREKRITFIGRGGSGWMRKQNQMNIYSKQVTKDSETKICL